MRVLLINTFHYHRGGDCTYTFAVGDLLKSRGHEVRYWGMQHPNNYENEDNSFFADYIDYNALNQDRSFANGVKVVSRCIYSFHAKKKLRQLLAHFKPDVAHLQGIMEYLTPSIIHELRRNGIPIVWTLHDYRLLCPDWHFLQGVEVCERCKGGKYYNCIRNRCKKGSLAASSLAATESYLYKVFSIKKAVNFFIAPSKFLYEKFIEYGWPDNKFFNFPYHLFPFPELERNDSLRDPYGVYLGGLVPWKGVDVLIDACKYIGGFQIRIVGDGHARGELIKKAGSMGLGNIRFEGFKRGIELNNILKGASFLVIPSRWYENCPYVIMEAQSYGIPVIGTRLGGIKNLVDDGEDGLLFNLDDCNDLAKKMKFIIDNPRAARAMGLKARTKAMSEYHPEVHYYRLMQVYENAIGAGN